jgi:hypothetical protein
MFKRIVGNNIRKRFSHIHSKTFFPENNNNKVIEELLREQNNQLEVISQGVKTLVIFLFFTEVTVATIALKSNIKTH